MASKKTSNKDTEKQPPPVPPDQGSWADQVENDEDDPNWHKRELEQGYARTRAMKSGKSPSLPVTPQPVLPQPVLPRPVLPHQGSWADQVEHDEVDAKWLKQELDRESAITDAMKSGKSPCNQIPAVTAAVEQAISPRRTTSDDETLPIQPLSPEQPNVSRKIVCTIRFHHGIDSF